MMAIESLCGSGLKGRIRFINARRTVAVAKNRKKSTVSFLNQTEAAYLYATQPRLTAGHYSGI
jgi:hypothetical protein